MLVIAKSVKGKEFLYNAESARKVSKRSANTILSVLNEMKWRLSEEVDKMPNTKENALLHHLAMDCRSWTFARLTQEEKESCVNAILWANRQGIIKGNFETRWFIMTAIYNAFLEGTGYKPTGWREEAA